MKRILHFLCLCFVAFSFISCTDEGLSGKLHDTISNEGIDYTLEMAYVHNSRKGLSLYDDTTEIDTSIIIVNNSGSTIDINDFHITLFDSNKEKYEPIAFYVWDFSPHEYGAGGYALYDTLEHLDSGMWGLMSIDFQLPLKPLDEKYIIKIDNKVRFSFCKLNEEN